MEYENFIESIKTSNFEESKSNLKFEYFNMNDKYGLKPIHWVCLSSDIDILEWMLQEKCDIEAPSSNGWRPIHFASFIGNQKVVQFLIEHFCKLNCLTNNGETVLDVSNSRCNHEFIDKILIENVNWRIGLSMGLKCGGYCDHKFCLRSLSQCKFEKDERIGLGMFASIFKVEYLQNNQQFAVKSVKNYYYDSLANVKCILPNVNKFLSSLNHSKIIKYHGLIKTEIEMNLFMELMDKGTLYDEIRKTGALDYDKIGRYCKDILEAVAFLHDKKILHGFIESKNILIDKNGGCKLTISSFSCSLADDDNQNSKKFWRSDYLYYSFVAPEINNNESLSYPYDIWWLGCTVIDMLTGEYLRYRWDLFDELKKIMLQIYNKKLKLFVEKMMRNKSTERASADELLKHEFIKNVSIDNSYKCQSINDNSRVISINIIQNAINNQQIGLSMGLKCNEKCQHGFCLSSMTAANFKKGKIIGSGAFGKVYIMNSKLEIQYAMKIIKIFDDNNIKESRYLENDINRYRQFINHENIVKYYGSVRNLTKLFIFMEFIEGGSLFQRIMKNKCNPLPLTIIKQYTKQIIKGLQFLHERNIIHRNIKSSNILINENNIVKIAGFGMSRFLRTISNNQKRSFCGTYNYISPEIINDEPYDCSADIWSLGATVFEMATGRPPYHQLTEMAVIFKIATTKTIEYPPYMSDDIRIFLNLMIVADPKNRSSTKSLLSCAFLN